MRRSYSAAGTFSLSLSRLDIEKPPGDIHRWRRTNLVVTGLWLLAFVQSPGKLEFHHTPKHGSWLNMAEIEFSIVSRGCLGQRLPDEDTLCREVKALEQERNEARAVINWRFTTEDARRKLHRLYPAILGVTEY